MMQLPFSEHQFLDAFGAYNTALWPGGVALWIASLVALVLVVRGSKINRPVSLLLAVHWAWAGIGYHFTFFAPVNPAAGLFGALFLIEAVLLGWAAFGRGPIQYTWARTPRHVVGASLAGFALLYPALAMMFVQPYPRTPTFGVPCPTTLFTIGLLMMSAPPRWRFAIIPLLWTLIGGSAAVFLGVAIDLMLLVATVVFLVYMGKPRLWNRHAG